MDYVYSYLTVAGYFYLVSATCDADNRIDLELSPFPTVVYGVVAALLWPAYLVWIVKNCYREVR